MEQQIEMSFQELYLTLILISVVFQADNCALNQEHSGRNYMDATSQLPTRKKVLRLTL